MNLLQNAELQQAIVSLLVVMLAALAKWVHSKFSQTALLNDNWCYIQPIVELVINTVSHASASGKIEPDAVSKIVSTALVHFADNYQRFEGKAPSKAVLAAASAELADAASRAVQ